MGFLKWLLWTVCAVSFGVWLGTGRVEGRTPLEHAQRAWRQNVSGAQLDRVMDGLQEGWDDARAKVAPDKGGSARAAPPRERISEQDRAALNKLLAQQQEGAARR